MLEAADASWTGQKEIFIPKEILTIFWIRLERRSSAQNIATGLSRNFPQHQQTFEKILKPIPRSWTTGSRAGKNGGSSAGRQICRVSSGVDLSC